jgi:hypothetical protein
LISIKRHIERESMRQEEKKSIQCDIKITDL